MSQEKTDDEREYINEFHRQWNERCMVERQRTLSTSYSVEFPKAQSRRLAEQVRQEEEKIRAKGRKKKNT